MEARQAERADGVTNATRTPRDTLDAYSLLGGVGEKAGGALGATSGAGDHVEARQTERADRATREATPGRHCLEE